MNSYSVNVQNNSGMPNSYYFFMDPPSVSNGRATVYPVIFAAMRAPPGGTASVEVPSNVYAITGRSQGGLSGGVGVQTSQSANVQLGTRPGGDLNPGSTVSLQTRGGRPSFGQGENPNGNDGAFSIRTGNDFRSDDARNGNWVIGVATARDDGPRASAVFTPEPGVEYQIQVKRNIYVGFGNNQEGEIVDPNEIGRCFPVDFSKLPSKSANVVHDESQRFSVR